MEERVAKLEVEMENLKDWQIRQNGVLVRIERSIQLNNRWLIGLLGGIIAALVMQIIGLIA